MARKKKERQEETPFKLHSGLEAHLEAALILTNILEFGKPLEGFSWEGFRIAKKKKPEDELKDCPYALNIFGLLQSLPFSIDPVTDLYDQSTIKELPPENGQRLGKLRKATCVFLMSHRYRLFPSLLLCARITAVRVITTFTTGPGQDLISLQSPTTSIILLAQIIQIHGVGTPIIVVDKWLYEASMTPVYNQDTDILTRALDAAHPGEQEPGIAIATLSNDVSELYAMFTPSPVMGTLRKLYAIPSV
ncbi:hypothetical protein BDQ17DRAFT_1323672 [Cyathus striatus]|nr:hypothetical protein BDQ17DRAFT_1323672 [Cyathus striatus]